MPGIVVFRRRWSVGSDDLVLPAIFLFLLHTTWFVILSVVLFGLVYNPHEACSLNLVDHGRGYLGILLSCMIAEMAIIWLSMRGGILYTEPTGLSSQECLATDKIRTSTPTGHGASPTMESLSDTESLYSFDSRRSSGFRSIRGSPSLHAVLERDEGHLFYIDPAIPEENPSLSSRTELLAADSLSKHSQDTQPLEAALGSGGVTPERPPSATIEEEEAAGGSEGGGVAPRGELALHNGRLGDSPSPQVLEFAEFIDSLFNLDSKSSSFQDLYCMMVPESPTSDYTEGPKSPSQQEILLRAQFEPNLVPKPPRLFAGSAEPSSGISLSPSFPLSSSGELMDLTPTGLSSQECLATDKIRTSQPELKALWVPNNHSGPSSFGERLPEAKWSQALEHCC